MKKLFGAKKKEEPKPPAPTLTDTSAKVLINIKIFFPKLWFSINSYKIIVIIFCNIARWQRQGDPGEGGRVQQGADEHKEPDEDSQGHGLQVAPAEGPGSAQTQKDVRCAAR